MPGHHLFARQQRVRRAASRCILLDRVGGGELETVDPMPVQARGAEFIVARQLRCRFPSGEAAVDFRPFQMLARGACSRHAPD